MSNVLDKIRATTQKKNGPLVRARRNGAEFSPERREKATQALEKYLPRAAKVWIDGLSACQVVYNGATKQYELSTIPDFRERRESARALWENVIGRPIERSMAVSGSYQELSELVAELKSSPEAQRLIAAGFFQSLLAPGSSEQSKAECEDTSSGTGNPTSETLPTENISPPQKTG